MTDNRATDELRKLLDERGVEWEGTPGVTFWGNCSALDITTNEKEKVHLHLCCTPEQAIAATIGSGTCKLELATDMESIRCSACGYKLPKGTDLRATQFCGGCGCEVER